MMIAIQDALEIELKSDLEVRYVVKSKNVISCSFFKKKKKSEPNC